MAILGLREQISLAIVGEKFMDLSDFNVKLRNATSTSGEFFARALLTPVIR